MPEEQTAQPQGNQEDEFEKAFAEFADDKPAAAPGKPAAPDDSAFSEGMTEPTEPQGDTAGGTPAAPATDSPSGATGEPAGDGSGEDGKTELEKMQARLDSTAGRLSASDRERNELKLQLQEANERLQAFEETQKAHGEQSPHIPAGADTTPQPGESKGEYLERMKETYGEDFANDLMAVIQAEIQAGITRAVTPLQAQTAEAYQTSQTVLQSQQERDIRNYFGEIGKAHPDYQNLVDGGDVLTWINEQPPYVAAGMMAVYNGGELATSKNVIDLLNQYKEARGLTKPKPNENPPAPKDATSAAAAAAVPSRGRSTPPQARPGEDDFDGWFNHFAETA